MTAMSATTRLAALLTAAMIGAAACGAIDDSSAPGEARSGGTLRLVGSGDIDYLDTAAAYYVPTWMLMRAMTRQLVSYPYSGDIAESTTPTEDLADSYEVSEDGLTYTFTISEGADWDVGEEGRQIVAEDVIRGFKRLCNPVVPSGAMGYYTGTIVGMQEYCDNWAADLQAQGEDFEVTPEYIATWVNENPIEGITGSDRTVTFNLKAPASDFLNILAMSFSSPVAEEMMAYLPDSPEFRQNFVSSGPYRIERYVPNQSIYLERNPNWSSGTDDLRAAHVDRIEIVEGSDQGPVQRQIEAGTADLAWDVRVPGPDVVKHLALQSPQLSQWQDGTITYLVFNLYEEDSPLQDLRVRQALGYAIDRENIARILGGPPLVEPTGQILTPEVIDRSAFQAYDAFQADGREAAVAQAQELLEEAGYEDEGDITLRFPYRTSNVHPDIAESIRDDLEAIGISVEPVETTPTGFYTDYLFDADGAKNGKWDIAVPGWTPDWYGNAGRSFLVPLLDGRTAGNGSTNFGGYNDDAVNALIDAALAAPNPQEAGTKWMEADREAMNDVPWVPLTVQKTARFHSERVGGYVMSLGTGPDLTNVWLTSQE